MKVLLGSIFAITTTCALVTSAPTLATPAAAPLNFCNSTSVQVAVFVGYYSTGAGDDANHDILTGPFVSEGPWVVDAGQCQEIHNPFDARYMFWFAVDAQSPHTPDDLTDTGNHMCVRGEHFTFEDENVSADACHRVSTATSHTVWVAPHKLDTVVNPTVTFTGWGTNY
jgi:uncharacterized membrane protein